MLRQPPKSANKLTTDFSMTRCYAAEDNVINQKVLRKILERLCVRSVEIVDNGRKAVDREAQAEFDLVLIEEKINPR